MKKKVPMFHYVAFVIRSLFHVAAVAMAVFICIYLGKDAATIPLKLSTLFIPLMAVAFAFFDLRFWVRELNRLRQPKSHR